MTGLRINKILDEFKTAHLGSMGKSGMYIFLGGSLSKNINYVNLL